MWLKCVKIHVIFRKGTEIVNNFIPGQRRRQLNIQAFKLIISTKIRKKSIVYKTTKREKRNIKSFINSM